MLLRGNQKLRGEHMQRNQYRVHYLPDNPQNTLARVVEMGHGKLQATRRLCWRLLSIVPNGGDPLFGDANAAIAHAEIFASVIP